MNHIRVYSGLYKASADYIAWSYNNISSCVGGGGCSECPMRPLCYKKGFTSTRAYALTYLPPQSQVKDYIVLTPETYPEVFI